MYARDNVLGDPDGELADTGAPELLNKPSRGRIYAILVQIWRGEGQRLGR
jgi:hypothetical protein